MNINDLNEEIKNNEAVSIYFSGKTCGVCQVLKPKIKDALDKNFPKIKQIYIDAQEFQETAASLNVFTIPTVIVYLDGREFLRQSRHISVGNFIEELNRPYDLYFN
ncbi:MAG: thioredoxin family protein [Campylobacterota bacterium]|nr:thioredoxin family protein [Campylobacterota bacterium]